MRPAVMVQRSNTTERERCVLVQRSLTTRMVGSTAFKTSGILRADEVDPLCCPHCGGEMKVVAFIEPPQGEVIERILRHCGPWRSCDRRLGESTDIDVEPGNDGGDAGEAIRELTYVDEDTFWATF